MGKEISSKPEAIRNAGNNIKNLETDINSVKTVPVLPRTDGYSDGLTAEGINQIRNELVEVETLIKGILDKLPEKLEKVALAMEESDNVSAGQFQ